jgi:hypothetical protein
MLAPGRAPACAEGEAGMQLGGEERGKHSDQSVGQAPVDPRGESRHGEAGGEPHSAAEEYEAGEGGEGAGCRLLLTLRSLHDPTPLIARSCVP